MGTMATVRINTSQRMVIYRDFLIHETDAGWVWVHEDDYGNGVCPTLFEAIDAVDNWHDNENEAAYERQQSLMESGGPDDSTYRRDMIAAGRGHLLGGR